MKRTKKPKVGTLVYDKDHQDWGIVIGVRKKGIHTVYTVQFIDDPEPVKVDDLEDSIYQELYD